MTTYAWPTTLIPSRTRMTYRSGVLPFLARSGAVGKEEALAQHWRLVIELDVRTRAERAALQAFVMKLIGGDHNFTMRDYAYLRRGSGAGTPLINGANQTGTSIITDGWTASAANVLLEGDQVQIRNQLCLVLDAVSANGSGQATLNVRPSVRIAPSDNASINSSTPTGTWKLLDTDFAWETDGGEVRSDFVLDCIEDVLA